MDENEVKKTIAAYLNAYNTFDIDGRMSVIHPDIEFENVSGGQVNALA